jgi:hypothetical protein
MAERWPVVITDDDGDGIEISISRHGVRLDLTNDVFVTLGPAQREQFAQAWMAACHEADRQGASDA